MDQPGEHALTRLNTNVEGLLRQSITEDWKATSFENCLKLKNAQHIEEIAIALKELLTEIKKSNAMAAMHSQL